MIVDQNDFGSVSAFVTKFEQTHDRLDVLVLNAAVGALDFEKSKDGWETS
jgi:NAD(P)-dependent dehydrogenase (short-subunit alcohol dehydrogenase family)